MKDACFTREKFEELVNNVLKEFDLLDKWLANDSCGSNAKQRCEDQDSVFNFYKGCSGVLSCYLFSILDLLFYGILNLAQKAVSQYADGEAALAMWKNSLADYHDAKKVLLKAF